MKPNSSLLVILFTFFSRILGFVRSGLTVWLFPNSFVSDQLNAVLAMPNGFRKLLAEGSLGVNYAFKFSQDQKSKEAPPGWDYLIRQAVWSLPTFIFLYFLSPFYISMFFPDISYSEDTLSSFRWAFLYIPLSAMSSVPSGFLSYKRQNYLLILGTLGFSLSTIAGLLLIASKMHNNWGFFIAFGGLTQLILLLIFSRCWNWARPGKARTQGLTKSWIFQFAFSATPILLFLAIQILASRSQNPGLLTALSIQYNLIQVPIGLLINAHSMESFSEGILKDEHSVSFYFKKFADLVPWLFLLSMTTLLFEFDIMNFLFRDASTLLTRENLLFLFTLSTPAIAFSSFIQKHYFHRGFYFYAFFLQFLGVALGFVLSFQIPSLTWTMSLTFGSLFLALPLLYKRNSRASLRALLYIGRSSLYSVPALIAIFLFYHMGFNLSSALKVLLAGGLGLFFLIVPSYIFRWKEVRFWEN